MKRYLFLIVFLLSSTVLAGGDFYGPVDFEIVGPTAPFTSGPVTYQLIIYPSGQSGTVNISVSDYRSVIYIGRPSYDITYTDQQPLTLTFELDIPPNDTNHISFSLMESASEPGRSTQLNLASASLYFAADKSTVNVFDHDPRPVRDYEMEALKRERDSARAVRDSIRIARKTGPPRPWDGWSGPLVTGRDSLGNETWDSIASERLKQGIEPRPPVTPPAPPLSRDSVEKLIKARQQESLEQARLVEEMRRGGQFERGGSPQEQMERFIRNHPIAEAVEFVADGPTLWVRREGDSVFTISTPINDLKAYREERAQRNAEKRADKQYDIVLDLSKPEDRAFVDKLHLDLKATDRVEYFRTTVDRSVVMKLEAAEITWTAYPLLPDRTFSPDYKGEGTQKNRGDSTKNDTEAEQDPSDILHYNNFETSRIVGRNPCGSAGVRSEK